MQTEQISKRIGVIAFQCVCIAVFWFAIQYANTGGAFALSIDGLVELELEPSQEVFPSTTLPLPSLFNQPSSAVHKKSYSAILPHLEPTQQFSLVVSGFRNHLELTINGAYRQSYGKKDLAWHLPNSEFISIPISDFVVQEQAPGAPLRIQFDLTSSGHVSASIGHVWVGPQNAALQAMTQLRLFKEFSPMLSLGLLLTLVTYLGANLGHSSEDKNYFLVSFPFILYAFVSLPVSQYIDSLTLFKIHQTSAVMIALFCAYYGVRELGLGGKKLRWSFFFSMVMFAPYVFISDFTIFAFWSLGIHSAVVTIVGLCHYFHLGWNCSRSNSVFMCRIMLVFGAALIASLLNDVVAIHDYSNRTTDSTLPFHAMLVVLLVLVRACTHSRHLTRQLLLHQEDMESLVRERTEALQITQAELLHHQRYKTLNAMGAAISHEIKNPLAAMQNDVNLMTLMNQAENRSSAPQLERLNRNIDRIDHTLTVLTDYSKRHPLKIESFQLKDWIRTIFEEENYASSNPKTKFMIVSDEPIVANFDEKSMRRVILNLVQNSLNASTVDTQKIIITLSQTDLATNIVIEDTGSGFGDQPVEKLCEPLVSGNPSGLGLGLAIVRDIIKLHAGEFSLGNSAELSGASVSIELPRVYP